MKKGREAKLNRAIFNVLAVEGPQSIYDTHKQIKKYRAFKHTYYPNVNKRMRALEQTGYLKIIDILSAKAGSEKAVYELTTKAYLAFKLDSISNEDILNQTEENATLQILVAFATVSHRKEDKGKSLH